MNTPPSKDWIDEAVNSIYREGKDTWFTGWREERIRAELQHWIRSHQPTPPPVPEDVRELVNYLIDEFFPTREEAGAFFQEKIQSFLTAHDSKRDVELELAKQELIAIQSGIHKEFTIGESSGDTLQDFGHFIDHHNLVEKDLKETKILLLEKNETANTFMNQVKKLQIELQEWKDILARRDKHIVEQNTQIVKLLTERDLLAAEQKQRDEKIVRVLEMCDAYTRRNTALEEYDAGKKMMIQESITILLAELKEDK